MEITDYVPTVYNWTETAVDCYKLGCICSKCHVTDNLESVNRKNCKVKSSVLQLVKKFGRPQKGINYQIESIEEENDDQRN